MISPISAHSPKAAVTVNNTSTLLLAKNLQRTHAIIQADAANTEPIFIGIGTTAIQDQGAAIYPGQHREIGPLNWTSAAIYGICTSGGMSVQPEEA